MSSSNFIAANMIQHRKAMQPHLEWLLYLKATGTVTDEHFRLLKRSLLQSIYRSQVAREELEKAITTHPQIWAAYQAAKRITTTEQ